MSSIAGDPARWQRYQDLRDGLLFTDARLAARARRRLDVSRRAPTTSAGAISAFSATTSGPAASVTGLWDEIPQFYSVDTRRRSRAAAGDAGARRRDAARDPERTGHLERLRADRAAVRSARAPRHRHRSTSSATPTTHLDITGGFTTHEALRRAAVGRELRLLQRHRGGAAVRLAHQRLRRSAPSGRTAADMLRVAYNGSWFNNLDDTLTWDNPLRLTTRRARPATAAWRSGRPTRRRRSARRLRQARAPDAAHGLARFGLWNNDEPLLPFTINCALPQFPLPRQTTEAAAHIVLDQSEPRLASDRRLAVQRPVPQLRLQQPHAGDDASRTYVTYDTSRRRQLDRRAGAATRTPATPSTPTRRGPVSSRWR